MKINFAQKKQHQMNISVSLSKQWRST